MSEAAIRAALYTAVNGVSNIGKVYDYKRRADTWPEFLALFKTKISGTEQIRGWDITYRGFTGIRDAQFGRAVKHNHLFWVQGYMGVNDADATDKTFAALAEAVVAEIDASATIHTGVYTLTGPASLEVEAVPLGSALCHLAHIVIEVPEQVS
jgi:hypothetical protein